MNSGTYHIGRKSQVVLLLSAALCLLPVHAASAADATVYFKNGDKMVGEIEKLESGTLHIEPDYADNVFQIEWDKVIGIAANDRHSVILSDGTRITAYLQYDSAAPGKVLISMGPVHTSTDLSELVYIEPIGDDILDRFDAEINFGLTYTKANNTRQITLAGLVAYHVDQWSAGTNFNFFYDASDEKTETQRWDASVFYRLHMKNNWFGNGSFKAESSDEQKLELRRSGSLSAGRYFVRNQRLNYSISIGGAYTSEQYTDTTTADFDGAEILAGTELDAFDIGDVDIYSYLNTYSSPKIGRFRFDFKIDLKWDLPLGFDFKISYTHNYTNKPAGDAPNNDFILSSTIGWEL